MYEIHDIIIFKILQIKEIFKVSILSSVRMVMSLMCVRVHGRREVRIGDWWSAVGRAVDLQW